MKSLALFCLLVPMLPAHAQLEGVIDLHVHSAPDSGPCSKTRSHGITELDPARFLGLP